MSTRRVPIVARWASAALIALLSPSGASFAGQAPEGMLGAFVDDYGIEYTITADRWSQGEDARYEVGAGYRIAAWLPEGRILARRLSGAGEGPAWVRIDWILLDRAQSEYDWAYCYAVYDAATAEEALEAPDSDRTTPRTGCNGFPFSRMKRRDHPSTDSWP